MSKRCVEDYGLTTPQKLRRSNVIAQSTMRGGHVYCVRETVICSFIIDFTCTHGGGITGNDCKRHMKSILLVSLNTHNHVDDYSGTSGGVRKVHISALVTVLILLLLHCNSFSVSEKKKKEQTS